MALISCGECGRQISNQAACCPGCGAPIQAATIKVKHEQITNMAAIGTLVGIILSVVAGGSVAMMTYSMAWGICTAIVLMIAVLWITTIAK